MKVIRSRSRSRSQEPKIAKFSISVAITAVCIASNADALYKMNEKMVRKISAPNRCYAFKSKLFSGPGFRGPM